MLEMEKLVTFELSARDTADAWNSLDGDEQATFFNILMEHGNELEKWLEWVRASNELTERGRAAMRLIGEYADSGESNG